MEIDWDDLVDTFLSTRTDQEYYLDLESGEIIALQAAEVDIADLNEEEAEQRALLGDEPDRFVEIIPTDDNDRVEWMEIFCASFKDSKDKDLALQLKRALKTAHPLSEVEKILVSRSAERLRWRNLQETQTQETVDAWLEENDVESDTPPPWKTPAAKRRRPPRGD